MEKIIWNKILYEWKFLQINSADIDFGNWKISNFEYASFKDEGNWVMIVALDDENNIYLVEQYQVWCDKRLLVLPRWWCKKWENIEYKANMELQEEIGMKAKNIKYLTEMEIFSWYIKAKSYLFLATNLEVSKLEWDEIEEIIVHKLPFEKAVEKIMNWEIMDSRTIAGIFYVKKYLERKK